jgi:hypothetical protein
MGNLIGAAPMNIKALSQALSQNHKRALEILNRSPQAYVQPEEPRAMKIAMHDLWRFGLANRQVKKPLKYKISFTGRRVADDLFGEAQ